MTTTQFDSYSDDIYAKGVDTLGMIVWQHVRDLRITESQLTLLANKHALPETPKLGHPADAFRRATSAHQHRDEATKVRFLTRPVLDNENAIIRHVIVEAVDVGNIQLKHAHAAWMKFDKKTETMTVGLAPTGTNLPTPIQQVALDIINAAKMSFQEFTTSLTGTEMTRFSMRQLSRMSHVTVHPNGGVYFVPQSQRAALKHLQEFVRELSQYAIEPGASNTFTVVPVPKLPDQIREIESGFRSSVDRELVGVIADIATMLASSDKPGPATVKNRVDEINAIRAKASEYSKLLGVAIDDVAVKLTMLDAQIEELHERATGVASDKIADVILKHAAVTSGAYRTKLDGKRLHVLGGLGLILSYEQNVRGYRVSWPTAHRNVDSAMLTIPEIEKKGSVYRLSTKDGKLAQRYVEHVLDKLAGRVASRQARQSA